MARFNNPLDRVRISAPCSAEWDWMVGDERVRYCSQCKLNVYNLSSMSKREAEALIEGTEGRLCVRYYMRADGTILTRECPVGLSAIRRKVNRVRTALVTSILTFCAAVGLDAALNRREPLPQIPAHYGHQQGDVTMGTMAVEAPPPRAKVAEPEVLMGRFFSVTEDENPARPRKERHAGRSIVGR